MFRRRLTSVGLGRRNARGFLSGASGDASLPTADLALRLDARLGVTTVSGDVSAWADQSGNGYDASQSVAGSRPPYIATHAALNNQPVLDFDGAGDHLLATAFATTGPEWSVYAVLDLDTAAANQNVYDDGASPRTSYRPSNGADVLFFDGLNNTLGAAVTGAQCLSWHQTGVALNGTVTAYRGGSVIGTANPTNGFAIGGTQATIGGNYTRSGAWLNAKLAALFVYDAAHDASARASVLAYIAQEWGV